MAGGKGEKSTQAEDRPAGSLLLLACSQRKLDTKVPLPALHLYDGVNYRVLRKVLLERGWPAGLQIKILSARYGLIDATKRIEPYDKRMNKPRAQRINDKVLSELKKISAPKSVFVNLGEDYLPAVRGLEQVFPHAEFAPGPIGMKMKAMKRWLRRLPYGTAALAGRPTKTRSYLYFFPDWDDFIYEPFSADEEKGEQGERTYAHEVCGPTTPFDGILLSLAQIQAGKGALHRHGNDNNQRIYLRRHLRVPQNVLLFGDCGAFSYVGQAEPPFSSEEAARLYNKYAFDIGASVDHIPLQEIPVRQSDGTVQKERLSEHARNERMRLTRDNAEDFLKICERKRYKFTPLGVIQGIGVSSYVKRLHEYIDMGYAHIALGGLVPRTDDDIVKIVCAVRQAIQIRTRACRENVWVHLFGILRPKLQPIFREVGVSSFDSASYFRKAWLRSDQNYLAPSGDSWYGTIRVPISTSKPMQQAAIDAGISEKQLTEMESRCLNAIERCGDNPSAKGEVTEAVNLYGPLLERKGEENHFAEKHALLLNERPWEKCSCPFCRKAGIHVVVFRGASRNKRRGLHNTWVFYHKVLHGKSVPASGAGTSDRLHGESCKDDQ